MNLVQVHLTKGGFPLITGYHLLALSITCILFIFVFLFYKRGKTKKAVILHQFMRLSFLGVLATGILLVPLMPFSLARGAKLLFGIMSLGMIEIFLMHLNKGDLTKFTTVSFIVILSITILLGLFLPLGIYLRF